MGRSRARNRYTSIANPLKQPRGWGEETAMARATPPGTNAPPAARVRTGAARRNAAGWAKGNMTRATGAGRRRAGAARFRRITMTGLITRFTGKLRTAALAAVAATAGLVGFTGEAAADDTKVRVEAKAEFG